MKHLVPSTNKNLSNTISAATYKHEVKCSFAHYTRYFSA